VGKGGAPRRDESAKELSDQCGRARTQTPGIVRIEPNGRAHARLVAAALCSPFVVAALWRGDDPFGSILLELAPDDETRNQRSSEVIRGHKRSSEQPFREVIRGHQRSSEAIGTAIREVFSDATFAPLLQPLMMRHAIGGNQRSSVTPPLLLFFNRFLAAAIAIAVAAAAAAAAAAAFSAFSFAFRAPCTPDEEPNRRPSERTQSALHTLMIRPDAAMRHAL